MASSDSHLFDKKLEDVLLEKERLSKVIEAMKFENQELRDSCLNLERENEMLHLKLAESSKANSSCSEENIFENFLQNVFNEATRAEMFGKNSEFNDSLEEDQKPLEFEEGAATMPFRDFVQKYYPEFEEILNFEENSNIESCVESLSEEEDKNSEYNDSLEEDQKPLEFEEGVATMPFRDFVQKYYPEFVKVLQFEENPNIESCDESLLEEEGALGRVAAKNCQDQVSVPVKLKSPTPLLPPEAQLPPEHTEN